MLKVGLIGCGMIADQHIREIKRIKGCDVAGVCDAEILMAEQVADRFHINRAFSNAQDLLDEVHPDVVHITTPPHTHYPLGKLCLKNGASVYMEKPFTVETGEAQELIDLAEEKGLKLTVGHNLQFSHEAIHMRELVKDGFLGGYPIHMESVQCFSHDDPVYGKAVLGDRSHWVRKLPGSLPQNLISHGISKIAEFISTDKPRVITHAFTSDYLKSIGQTDIVDEVRAVIYDDDKMTAYFTLSTQMKPGVHQFRIWGPTNSLMIDNTHRMIIPLKPVRFKSYLRYFFGPYSIGKLYRKNGWSNIMRFLRRDFHEGYGMKILFEKFYRAVAEDTPPPISYKQILTTSRIMDSIFQQFPANRNTSVAD